MIDIHLVVVLLLKYSAAKESQDCLEILKENLEIWQIHYFSTFAV